MSHEDDENKQESTVNRTDTMMAVARILTLNMPRDAHDRTAAWKSATEYAEHYDENVLFVVENNEEQEHFQDSPDNNARLVKVDDFAENEWDEFDGVLFVDPQLVEDLIVRLSARLARRYEEADQVRKHLATAYKLMKEMKDAGDTDEVNV